MAGDESSVLSGKYLFTSTKDLITNTSWQTFGKTAIGVVVLSTVTGVANLIQALFNLPIAIVNMFAELIPAINNATLGGIAGFLETALAAAAGAFGAGWTGLLGPLQGPFGVGLALFMFWEVLWFLDYTDSDAIGFVMDLPDILLNSDDSGVADEDE